MEKYLGIIYLLEPGATETFSLSRELDTLDKDQITDYLVAEAQTTLANVDTILVIGNGKVGCAPEVVEFWSAINGDFDQEYCGEIEDDVDDHHNFWKDDYDNAEEEDEDGSYLVN